MGALTETEMDEETQRLVERWILTFLETPVLADAELLTQLLAEHADSTEQRAAMTDKVAASADNAKYLVESDKTGARAAHKPGELRKA